MILMNIAENLSKLKLIYLDAGDKTQSEIDALFQLEATTHNMETMCKWLEDYESDK